MKKPDISIVIPIYNEEKNVGILYKELVNALKAISSYEIIFVDDGSTDKSLEILRKIAVKDKKIKIVSLISNFGQSSAISAGISQSSSGIIVTMDSDLQHDPRNILPMVKKIDEGYHVVCGWRKDRGPSDSFFKKTIPSKISNLLIRLLAGTKLHDTTGGMRAFSRKVVEVIPFYGEMHRYLPVLAQWKGFRITEVPISIRKRRFGKTKYDYKRIFRGSLDLITIKFFIKYSTRTFHIFGVIGIFSLLVGISIGLFYVYQNFAYDTKLLEEIPSLLLAVVLMLLGIMFLGFGFIADMISFDTMSSQKRKSYIIDRVIGYKNH